jgi:hypothetical protein
MVNIEKLKILDIEKLKNLDKNELLKIVNAINWDVVLTDTAKLTNILKLFKISKNLKAFNTLNALKAFNVEDLENIIKNIVKLYLNLNLNLNKENINNLIIGINTLGAKIKFKFELV